MALYEELLVVIEHVEAAFEIAEQDGDRLDALLIGEVLEPLLLDLVLGTALHALFLRLQVQLFQFVRNSGVKSLANRSRLISGELESNIQLSRGSV